MTDEPQTPAAEVSGELTPEQIASIRDEWEEKVSADAVRDQAWPAANLRNRWLCPQGHTLGVTKTEKVNRFKSKTTLILFPLAMLDDELVHASMPVHQIAAGIICCTKCGAIKEWKAR